MNDNVSYAMDMDFREYELRTVIEEIKRLAECPATRHLVKKYSPHLVKSCQNLEAILKELP